IHIVVIRQHSVRLNPQPHPFIAITAAATAEIYTLSLHDALPIFLWAMSGRQPCPGSCTSRKCTTVFVRCAASMASSTVTLLPKSDRKSTRLNSSHLGISYAVFCLKKKTESGSNTAEAAAQNAPAT